MLSQIVGQIDANAAFVLAVLFVCICIIATSLIVKRRSRSDIANEFFLAKMKQEAETSHAQYVDETSRSIAFKKIDQGLITSHREE